MDKNRKDKSPQGKTYTLEELQGRPPRTIWAVIAMLGLITIAVGTLLPIFAVRIGPDAVSWWKYVYAAGAVCFLLGKLFSPYTGIRPRIKRLYRIEAWSAVFFCVAALFLFLDMNTMRDVWAFTLAGGALLIFTTIAIPRTVSKTLKNQSKK